MGDKSDNLPGIPGIGEKKAVKYLQTYGTLDNIIEHRSEIKGADGIKISENYEQALLCRKMATIIRDFDINLIASGDCEKHTINFASNNTAVCEIAKTSRGRLSSLTTFCFSDVFSIERILSRSLAASSKSRFSAAFSMDTRICSAVFL